MAFEIKNLSIDLLFKYNISRDELVPVPGYEGYFCTRKGRMFSTMKGFKEIATNSRDKDGYLKATLFLNKKPIHFRKHRIIALTFLGDSELMINHKNGIKDDNRVENLEYVSERENQSHWRISKGYDVGVCWAKKEKKWRAYFQENHNWEHLGFFNTKEEAKEVYLNRLKQDNIRNIYSKA